MQGADACCHPKGPIPEYSNEPVDSKALLVKKVCRIALTLFAAVISPYYFGISCGIGSLIGLGYVCKKIFFGEKIPHGQESPQCGRGWLEDLSGIQCSPMVSAAATAVFVAGHMHHSPFYVLFCGVPLGFYYGMQMGIGALQALHKLQEQFAIKSPFCSKA